ncbi:MAG: hypothetical protein ACE5Q3_15060 [Alphaproteobacteria bacterium]
MRNFSLLPKRERAYCLRTADIMQPGMKRISTTEMGEAVVAALDRLAA